MLMPIIVGWLLCSIIAVLIIKKGGAPDESWSFFLKDVFITNFGWWPVLLLLAGPLALLGLLILLIMIGVAIFVAAILGPTTRFE